MVRKISFVCLGKYRCDEDNVIVESIWWFMYGKVIIILMEDIKHCDQKITIIAKLR